MRRGTVKICLWEHGRGVAEEALPAAFVSKLTDAVAEAEETCVRLEFAGDCGYLKDEDHLELTEAVRYVSRMLMRMISRPERWCMPL